VRGIDERVQRSWVAREEEREPVWAPVQKPLARSTVALLSSAAIAMNDDAPFDQELERRDPWRGDPGFRLIPRTATEADVACWHLHIHPEISTTDLDCQLPMRRLAELVEAGEVGASAEQHYSICGYQMDTSLLERQSVPAVIQHMRGQGVDLLLLVPV
jgi:D-proline reductase (dithiol) PrdB